MAKAATTPAGTFFANWRQNIIYIGFVAIFVVFALTLNDKGFLNPNNLLNIVRQTAMIAVMAVAMTFVLSAGEIDLSVGAVAGLATVTVAMADIGGRPAGRYTGRTCDGTGGRDVQRLAHHQDRHTLLSDDACHDGHRQGRCDVDLRHRGRSDPVARLFLDFRRRIGRAHPGSDVLGGTDRGRRSYRPSAVRLWSPRAGNRGGVRRRRATPASTRPRSSSGVLVLSSCAAALAGMLYAGRLQSGRFQLGEGDELSVIAAAVLGARAFSAAGARSSARSSGR